METELIKELSIYGKVEVLEVTELQVEVKITDGFNAKYEPTMRVGELMLDAYPQFKSVRFAKSEVDLCHYIFV